MTILLVGGGSGGHITPVLAVAEALKHSNSDLRLVYVIGRGDKLIDIPSGHPEIDQVVQIRAGKFRRYHQEGWRQILDVRTLLLNIRDFFYTLYGLVQSFFLLGKFRPQAIFIKGGFVGVPIGLMAALRGIPYVTHDSDAIPGLANRIIGRWAHTHAVSLDAELYPYPKSKTITVGVPVANDYQVVSKQQKQEWRASLGIPKDSLVVCVTGGGNGSELVNSAITAIAPKLFTEFPNLYILHIAGRDKILAVETSYTADQTSRSRVIVKDFVTDLARYSGASDVIVTRAGANALADFAAQQRACIVVPNPALTGGHQLKNADALASKGAIRVVAEQDLRSGAHELLKAIEELLQNEQKRSELAKILHDQSSSDAAEKIARILTQAAEGRA